MANLIDHALPVLAFEPTIDDDQRADLWDKFHTSADADELAQRLPMDLQPKLKADLLAAKRESEEPAVIRAIRMMAKMDPQILDAVEKDPRILETLLQREK